MIENKRDVRARLRIQEKPAPLQKPQGCGTREMALDHALPQTELCAVPALQSHV
jgi:hypothetical protein